MIHGSSESLHTLKVTLEYGQDFSFIKHFLEFLGGSRDNSSFSRNAISVYKLYFESPLGILELLFRVKVTSTRTLSGTEHNSKKSTLSLLKIILFNWPKYFDTLKIWQNLPIVFQTLKVFVLSALTFKLMTSKFLVSP